ncbi:hypothetical protein FB45DRAFT_186942 [Roridomyces roridus]|uniref:RanBD1 domain-containing protein n=1 Tax=Roridomyces roridus TaxID=1738132 RepID=A0AAD7CGW0_9AGAR|nr:hypothetical protein FB45DRAFT_186942 [Roridomyces roridus]
MKRGADRQITKDEGDDEIEEVTSSGAAFSKADDAVLAGRKIKAMPRRGGASPAPSATESPATPPPSKFGAFAGFGTPAASPHSFSFTPSSASPSFPPAAKPASNPFAAPPTTSTPTLFGSGAPVVASTASNAAKTFAGLLGDSSAKPTSTDSESDSTPTDEVALKYYKSLRGLNVSILEAITKAIDQDPFADVAGVLKSYSELRLGFQKEFDSKSKPELARSSAPSPSPSAPTLSAPTPAPPSKMPTAPTAFAGFGGFGAKPAASSTPQPDVTKSAPAGPAPPSNPFSFGSSSSSTIAKPSPTSLFGSTTTTPAATPTKAGSLFSSTSTGSLFGSAPAPQSPSSTGLSFGSSATSSTKTSLFGAPASPSPSSFVGAAKAPSSLFGSGAFGGSTTASSSTGFSFAKGSLGNPVGFGFGSPKADEKEKEEKKSEDGEEDTTESGSGESQGQSQATDTAESQEKGIGAASTMLFGGDEGTGLDAEGEGEEEEETVHAARVKAFRMKKNEDGGNGGWLDIGIGMLRLKKHKETSARRVLMRNSQSGKILINFALYSGLKPTQTKKTMSFIGHDETGDHRMFNVRFRSEEAAKEFCEFLEREVAAVKAG